MSSVRILHHLCNMPLVIISPSLRCVRRINRISYINVVKPASASVTIVFDLDDSDRQNSPPEMENYAQITVMRQVRSVLCHARSTP
jgi:hypothetical protein